MDLVHVFRKVIHNGVEIKIGRKKFQVTYETSIWNKFPAPLRSYFADSLAYVATWHLPFLQEVKMVYHFAHPPIESVFFKILIYALPMTIFENEGITTSEIIKKFYNLNFQTQFKALNHIYTGQRVKKNLKEKAVLLFSFGKDSLLSYGLLKELSIPTKLIFFKEPQSPVENNHKKKLSDKFYKDTKEEVEFFPLSIGKLREEDGFSWGWDVILSQYTFLLLPYFFCHQTKYLFMGNEQSCNFCTKDSENFLINPVFEQSVAAMQLQQDIPKLFFIRTHVGSLIEPIHEIFITYILHHRYPQIGQYQMSCHADTPQAKTRRWCGFCEKCARMYIFFRALNINPEKVGFCHNNMLSLDKEGFYSLFDKANSTCYGGSGLGKDEQLLAFYLAYKNGVKGELINKFKSLYLVEAEKKKDKLIAEYFGINSSLSLPASLRKKTLKIFKKEQESALNYIKIISNK